MFKDLISQFLHDFFAHIRDEVDTPAGKTNCYAGILLTLVCAVILGPPTIVSLLSSFNLFWGDFVYEGKGAGLSEIAQFLLALLALGGMWLGCVYLAFRGHQDVKGR